MPPKTNKRKFDGVDNNEASTKKLNLDVSAGIEIVVEENKNELGMEVETNKTPSNPKEGEMDEEIERLSDANLAPKFRATIQNEVKRMKGLDYSTTIIQVQDVQELIMNSNSIN